MSEFMGPHKKAKPEPPDNQCPGCGSLNTFNHATLWRYYCKPCGWGFGHPQSPRDYDKEQDETIKAFEGRPVGPCKTQDETRNEPPSD